MPEILSTKSIEITLELLEIDNYMPSMKMFFKMIIKHPTGLFTYEADDIWFEGNKWDEFSAGINQILKGSIFVAYLKDMSEYLSVTLKKEQADVCLDIQICEPDTGYGMSTMTFKSVIDIETLEQLNTKVTNFNRSGDDTMQ